jgi:hypothetical protein
MATKDEIIDTLIGIIIGGRGGIGGENPKLGIPSFYEALEQDRRRGSKARRQAKRQASKAQKAYGRAFKRLAPKYKKKNGAWKKDGFKRCVRAAHRECRGKRR